MSRANLWLAGLQVLSLVAIGWLWSENQSLRAHPEEVQNTERKSKASPTGQEGKLPVQRETVSGPKLGTPKWSPVNPRKDARTNALRTETSQRPRTVSPGPSRAGRVGSREDRLPEEEPVIPETGPIAAPQQPEGDSLIVNGGFDGELAPWLCEEGRVIRDAADERNSLLQVTLKESGFRLTQSFEPPAGKAHMTLSFRARVSEESDLLGFHLLLLGGDDKPLTMTFVDAGKPGEWKKIEWKGPVPVTPASLRIESLRGNGAVWIDDVRLVPSTAVPETAQGQAR